MFHVDSLDLFPSQFPARKVSTSLFQYRISITYGLIPGPQTVTFGVFRGLKLLRAFLDFSGALN